MLGDVLILHNSIKDFGVSIWDVIIFSHAVSIGLEMDGNNWRIFMLLYIWRNIPTLT